MAADQSEMRWLDHSYRGQAPPTLETVYILKKNMILNLYYFQVLKTGFIVAPQAKTRFAL